MVSVSCNYILAYLRNYYCGVREGTILLIPVFMLPIGIIYHTVSVGKWGCGLGKASAGLSVVDLNSGKIGYLRAFFRSIARYISTATLSLGYLLAAISKDQRTLHDYFAGTKVICGRKLSRYAKAQLIVLGLILVPAGMYFFRIAFSTNLPYCVPEKARAAEALNVISGVKSAQERHLSRHNRYAGRFTELDIDYPRKTADSITTNFFTFSISTSGCGAAPCHVITATRHTDNATVAHRYGLYSVNAIVPGHPLPQIASCPGGGANCDELLQ